MALLAHFTDWQSELPFLGWKILALFLTAKFLGYAAGMTALRISTAVDIPLTQPHIDAYIREHGLKPGPPQPPPDKRLAFYKSSTTSLMLLASVLVWIIFGMSWNSYLQKDLWSNQLTGMAAVAGRLSADRDFEAGQRRVYEIAYIAQPSLVEIAASNWRSPVSKFTGRTQGLFQVWSYPCELAFKDAGKRAAELYVETYNAEMAHRAKFPKTKPAPSSHNIHTRKD